MRLFLYISDFIVPFMILSILIYGIFAGVNVYDTFIQGAKRGFWTVGKSLKQKKTGPALRRTPFSNGQLVIQRASIAVNFTPPRTLPSPFR